MNSSSLGFSWIIIWFWNILFGQMENSQIFQKMLHFPSNKHFFFEISARQNLIFIFVETAAQLSYTIQDGNQDCLKYDGQWIYAPNWWGVRNKIKISYEFSQHKVWLMKQQRYFSIGSGQTPMKWFDNGLKMSYFMSRCNAMMEMGLSNVII